MTDSLHPSVKQFKAFIKDHPELVKKSSEWGIDLAGTLRAVCITW